jgi:type II secretory pathway predicted ATPase ExeA
MYEEFYGFSATPFTRGIPGRNLFLTPELSEVISRMEYVAKCHLFAVLTGDSGTGKTTILRRLNDQLDPRHYRMLYISDSKLTPRNFYRLLLEPLGVIAKRDRTEAKRQLHSQLTVMQAVDGVNTVCVVDEAHLLSFEMLEEIRFLLNVNFDSVSPVALILAGQPELWKQRLSLQKCVAIRQRIDIQSVLNHYDRSRAGEYIRHHLSYAGADHEIFTDAAITEVYEYSTGIPRIIDKVCTNVLIYGSQNRMQLIDDHAVRTVLECEFS